MKDADLRAWYLWLTDFFLLALKYLLLCSKSPDTSLFQARGREPKRERVDTSHFPFLTPFSFWFGAVSIHFPAVLGLFPLKSCSSCSWNHIMKGLIICWTVVCPGCFVGRNLAAPPRLQTRHSLMLAQHLKTPKMCSSASCHVTLKGLAHFRDGETEVLGK